MNEKYNGRLTSRAKKDITRLRKGEPVDYVIGYKNFCGCKIDLRHKPLIPRDETKFWVKQVIAEKPKPDFGKLPEVGLRRVLDMFAGSGCCGIAVLKNIPNSHCDFCDIDDNCLKQIRLNLKINNIDKRRYRLIKSDVFKKLLKSDFNRKYDLILANPPYIGLGQKKKVQKSVLDFEPKQALFARDKGLFFIKKFLQETKNYLADKGVIYLEFGYNQKKDVKKLLKRFAYLDYQFEKDQFCKWRFVEIKN